MKTVRIHEYGGTEQLRVDEVEIPTPQKDEVLIKVAVAGMNYADTMLRAGTYLVRPPLPFTPGFEAAGTIAAVGDDVKNFRPGDRVMATMQGGGYAEYAVAKAAQVVPVPEELDFGRASALLVQGLTALGLLRDLKPGQTILIHAAAGGVGSLLVQLAKIKGARVIGTASTAEKLATVKKLGADVTVNYTEGDWPEQILRATDGKGIDLLIEMVGGEVGAQNMRCLAKGGTMIVYGAASGQDFSVSALNLLGGGYTVKGYLVYNETPESMARFTNELMTLINENKLQVMVQEFPLAEAARAHEALAGRQTTGKVVLTV
ncbi:MAG TPA: quinone oxidoreductase [Pyrinomonadaceae bacterium]|nr:quinone oxidoreductase [Pyrinomonadaceae bacterium]